MSRKRRKWGAGLAALAGVGAIVFALWPRGPRLVPFTSETRLTSFGTVRLSGLIPTGWKVESADEGPAVLMLRPEPRWTWLPSWLRNRLIHDDTYNGFVGIGYLPQEGIAKDHLVQLLQFSTPPEALLQPQYAFRRISDHPLFIRYWHPSRGEFEATYRQVCESFRVIQ